MVRGGGTGCVAMGAAGAGRCWAGAMTGEVVDVWPMMARALAVERGVSGDWLETGARGLGTAP